MVMQNSSKPYKSKSSKYRSEDLDESKDSTDDLSVSLGGSDLKGIPTIVICQRDNRQRGRSGRGRDEGRPPFNKNGERRGGRSSRGGPFRNRNDRDAESTYHRSKESTSRSGCYKHANDVDFLKNKDGISLLPEDCRISKLLRRISAESDLEKFFAIAKQLKEAIQLPDNERYIRRSLDYILDSLLDIVRSGPSSDARLEGAKCIGVTGIALEQDAKRLIDWVFNTFHKERTDDARVLLLRGLEHMLEMDAEHNKLKDLINGLMSQLQQTLENTEKPEILYACGDVILALNRIYPDVFAKFFRDIVDILIGWHIDMSQPSQVTQYASHALRQLHSCWVADLPFSLNLLSQFLEDMETYSEDLMNPHSGGSSPEEEPSPSAEDCLLRITSFIQVFTSVIRSLDLALIPKEGSPVTMSFLIESLERVLTTALTVMDHPDYQELTLVAANESVCLLLKILGTRASGDYLYDYIYKQLELSPSLSSCSIISSLELTAKTVRECSANLPETLIHHLLGQDSPLLELRLEEHQKIENAILEVYHSLLSLKNIPLLQEAYRYVLQDLEQAYSLLVSCKVLLCTHTSEKLPTKSENNPYNNSNAERVVVFLLKALGELARASNSIIGMWALKPTIMELLAVSLLPADDTLSSLSPSLQHAMVFLLYTHCSRYNNFVSSTGLVPSGRSSRPQLPGLPASLEMSNSSSPTSGHLSLILKLVTTVLSKNGVCSQVEILCLHWVQEILTQAKGTLSGLMATPIFIAMLQSLIRAGSSHKFEIAVGVAECFKVLLSLLQNPLGHKTLLHDILGLCALHLDSVDPNVRNAYHHLLLLLPWHVVLLDLPRLGTISQNGDKSRPVKFMELVHHVNRVHSVRSYTGEMESQNFKKFMSFLLKETKVSDPAWLSELLSMSLPVPVMGVVDEVAWLRLAVEVSLHAQFVWCTWHASQFCVSLKLRTPLGKPMETFNAIEGAIKGLARVLNNDMCTKDEASSWHELQRARLLLAFLEHLEKNIYNAAEGCAFSMPLHSKPVRIFFHTNKAVCAEWIGRVRLATMLVALHADVPSIAVRHGFGLLQDMLDQNNTQGADFERSVLIVASALLALQESEALQGLYVWCRDKAARKLPWLKVAALQASKRYEDAVIEYTKLLLVDDLQQELQVKSFIVDQVLECLRLLGNWTKCLDYKTMQSEMCKLQNSGAMFGTIASALSVQHVKNLCNFEQLTDFPIPWIKSCESDKPVSDLWRPSKILATTEEFLSNAIFDISRQHMEPTELQFSLLNETKSSVTSLKLLLEEGIYNKTCETYSSTLILHYVAKSVIDFKEKDQPMDIFNTTHGDQLSQLGSSTLLKILKWNDQIHESNHSVSTRELNAALSFAASKCARKEGNLNLAKTLLLRFWKEKSGETDVDLNILQPAVWAKQHVGMALKETAKLLYSLEMTNEATNLLANSALECARCAEEDVTSVDCQIVASRLLTSLAKKIKKLSSSQTQAEQLAQTFGSLNIRREAPISSLAQLLVWGNTVADTRKLAEWDIQLPDVADDFGTQQLLQLSLISCPRNAKAWSQFASWCYRRGRRAIEWEEEGAGPILGLSDADKEKVVSILGSEATLEECESVISTLQQLRQYKPEDEDTLDIADTFRSLLSETTNDLENKVDQLILLWSQRTQSHCYYHACAIAYFKFLQFCASEDNSEESLAEATLTATLRLLRLIVKHATSLQDVLESGLALTPTTPWKGIIPQLFARLSHPELYVRRRLSELLCRLASDAPHLILFPAVVGCSLSKATQKEDNILSIQETDEEDDGEEEEDEDDEEEECTTADDNQSTMLRGCFVAMVDTLSQQAPASTAQVRLLVSELRRITVLWDELWLGCLIQHQADITRRLSQIESEIKQCEENESLSLEVKKHLCKEKYRIIMKPVIVMFEHLRSITSVPAETPHEKTFQTKYQTLIDEALTNLKNPPDNKLIKAQTCWQPFHQLQMKLQQQAQKRGAHSLKLTEISPLLANLRDSAIAMPGLSQSQTLVTIAALENNISVLPTKTRPKKLVLSGSDGRNYTYLFKGLEDLHLDERIMQFLGIANTMMARVHGSKYQARHYSVVPLGARSGLISWVDGVQPMFAVYKRWQQREATIQQLRNNTTQPTVMRPSELFYNKLTPLLAERGIAVENRKEWPAAVMKQVLIMLMNETPKDLLAKELWCMSENAADWWKITKNYSCSVAVMSVIGYIIGLGDRHLDNLLINLSTGEVVHIDYNVCFEKGQTLRVPEKVPFRMTPNLQTALGLTEVEGIFRVSCEQVLRVLKSGRETLLTLLEAFVYDPLVDWTPGSEAGYTGAAYGGQSQHRTTSSQPARPTRKELERETARDMLAVRVTEMRGTWLVNRDALVNTRVELSEDLTRWMSVSREVCKIQEELADAHQQIALLKEAGAAADEASHALFSLHARYAADVQAREARAQASASLQETHAQAIQQNARIQAAVMAIRGSELPTWATELSTLLSHDGGNREIFDIVQEFLHTSGQSALFLQCEQSEVESIRLTSQIQAVCHSCLELLGRYRIEAALFPYHKLECPYTRQQVAITEDLLRELSAERCQAALVQMHSVIIEASHIRREQVEQYHMQLQHAIALCQARIQAACTRLSNEKGTADLILRLDSALVHVRNQTTTFAETSSTAIAAATMKVLCDLNTRLLSLETAAGNSGDSLVDLTLREGDWFLDKLLQLSGLTVEFANVLLPIAPESQSYLRCLHTTNDVYKGLEDLLWNVSTIIIPEAVTALSTQQTSVLALVNGLSDLIMLTGRPLPELCKELELPHPNTQRVCSALRDGLEHLLQQQDRGDQPLSQGQMLLMGFNGLFEKLQNDASKLITTLAALDVPPACQRLDQLYKARHLSWSIMKPGSQRITHDLFLVLRLQAMHDVFALCTQSAGGFVQPETSQNYITEEIILQPVRRFAAEFVRHQLIGLMPQAIAVAMCSVLLQKLNVNITDLVEQREVGAESRVSMAEVCLLASRVDEVRISQAAALLNQLEMAWRQRELATLAQREAEAATAHIQRLQLRVAAYAWLNDLPHSRRPVFVEELRQAMTSLINLQSSLNEVCEHQRSLVSLVIQRLKWAAGANPTLAEVVTTFNLMFATRQNRIQSLQQTCAHLIETCSAILHLETLRNNPTEAASYNNGFLQLLGQCEQNLILVEVTSNLKPLCAAEKGLAQIMPLEQTVDMNWILAAETVVADRVKQLSGTLSAVHSEQEKCLELLRRDVSELRAVLTKHHDLVVNVRALLRTLTKQSENNEALGMYLQNYRNFSEKFSFLVRNVNIDELDINQAQIITQQLTELSPLIGPIYEELLGLPTYCETTEENMATVAKSTRPPLMRQEVVSDSPKRAALPRKPPPFREKVPQEKNAYALSVWRRVRAKLEGRDLDSFKKASVAEQVEYIINEATSLDNLCLLYEGWTPWV